jgi:hypothetical protein
MDMFKDDSCSFVLLVGVWGADIPSISAAGKQIERCVISTFQIAESMGFKG